MLSSSSASTRHLGLDPGYGRCGWAVVEARGSAWALRAVGCLETPAGSPFEERLIGIHTRVLELCREHQPVECALERLYFSKNVRTALAVAEARGVLRLALAQSGVPVVEVDPGSVKLAPAGSGSATKAQVGRMVVRLLGLEALPKPDDAADAAAIAVAGLRTRPLRGAARRALAAAGEAA